MIIYKATFPNGKVYIGATTRTLADRIGEHRRHSRCKKKRHYNMPISVAIRKHGFYGIRWEVIKKENTVGDMYKKEIELILKHNAHKQGGYNCRLRRYHKKPDVKKSRV